MTTIQIDLSAMTDDQLKSLRSALPEAGIVLQERIAERHAAEVQAKQEACDLISTALAEVNLPMNSVFIVTIGPDGTKSVSPKLSSSSTGTSGTRDNSAPKVATLAAGIVARSARNQHSKEFGDYAVLRRKHQGVDRFVALFANESACLMDATGSQLSGNVMKSLAALNTANFPTKNGEAPSENVKAVYSVYIKLDGQAEKWVSIAKLSDEGLI